MSLSYALLLAVLVATMSLAAVSAWGTVESINAEDAGSAWGWAAVFLGTSLMAVWFFWSLIGGVAA